MMQSRFLGELPEAGVEIETPRPQPARRATWAPRQDSWRSYGEGDPDTFWSRQGLDADTYEARAAGARGDSAGGASGGGSRAGASASGAAMGGASTTGASAGGAPLGWAADEESQEHATLEVGMQVRHEKFGVGQVLRIEGHGERMKVTVVFGRSDARKFVARYARLVPVR
jgi:hypothetical protein